LVSKGWKKIPHFVLESEKMIKEIKYLLVSLFLIFTLKVMITGSVAFASQTDVDIGSAMVKIYAVNGKLQCLDPWNILKKNKVRGSGFIIKGNRILTSAHVVANLNLKSLEVQKYGESKKYKGRILYISYEADLALLTVDNKEFFLNVKPIELGNLPEVQQNVLIFGFPEGNELTVNKGILVRIKHQIYKHSNSSFLAGEIYAPVSPGNSGGPVIIDGRAVGLIMQAKKSENLYHMVPSPVIKHFLEDIDDGRYDGFPDIGLLTQKMENPYMKQRYKMSKNQTGILINKIFPGSPAEGKLQEEDILIAINGYRVGDDSTIEFRPRERISYTYAVEMQQIGDIINVEILRVGKIMNFALLLTSTKKDFLLIPPGQYSQEPRYFIFGGIVFSPLTKDLVDSCKNLSRELNSEIYRWPASDRKEIVVISNILNADINKGYEDFKGWIIAEVNDRRFRDFNEFYYLVTTSNEPYIVFKNTEGYQIVIDRKKARESHDEILRTYNIKQDKSADLKALEMQRYSMLN
jgi:S1-C subfamily serine protease